MKRSRTATSVSRMSTPQRHRGYTLVFAGIFIVFACYLQMLLTHSRDASIMPVLIAAVGFLTATCGFVSYCQAERRMRGEARHRCCADAAFAWDERELLPERLGAEIRRKLVARTLYSDAAPYPPESRN